MKCNHEIYHLDEKTVSIGLAFSGNRLDCAA